MRRTQPRNSGHVNDPKLTAMLKEQRRTKDLEARKQLIFDIQRYVAEQQYYVIPTSTMITGSWQPYVKNYAPNPLRLRQSRCGAVAGALGTGRARPEAGYRARAAPNQRVQPTPSSVGFRARLSSDVRLANPAQDGISTAASRDGW